MPDFLFHKVSEKEKEEIKKEALKIVHSFSKKLEGINNLPKETIVEGKEYYREEILDKEKSESEKKEFKKKILDNANKKDKDFILSEKKKW